MEDDRGMVMEVEGAWNLGKMNMLSCMRAGIAVWVCCTGVGGGGVGDSVGVDDTDSEGSGGYVGGDCGNSDSAGSIGESWLCENSFWVEWWGLCSGGGAGGIWTGFVV